MIDVAVPGAAGHAEPVARWFNGWGGGSGPDVALVFHRALAAIFLVAWLSLATQVRLLVGSRGLLPLVDFVEVARDQGLLSIVTFPSLLAWAPGDGPLLAGCVVGAFLAVLGLLGVRPRLFVALQTVLYLGYVTACRGFLGFQWDNLLLECGLLATFLPARRSGGIAHMLFRALLFKLYFESGIAKWQSPLHDWQDGTAMTFYYETAPLPTALAWYAHHLPRWWHLFESRATLVLELGIPFAAFGPRRARLVAAALLTLFQIANMATANYGFFCPLSVALHLFLLDDGDVRRPMAWVDRHATELARSVLGRLSAVRAPVKHSARRRVFEMPKTIANPGDRVRVSGRVRQVLAAVGVAIWILFSMTEALFHFGEPGTAAAALVPALELSQSFRVINTYHLFAAVTRERIEPEIQIQVNGTWVAYDLRYKPGDPDDAPRFVAPHQPRVDFLLWFYGLGFERRQPIYVATLLSRLCEDSDAMSALFKSPLPRTPDSVRIVFWSYHFTSLAEKTASGSWWTRRELHASLPFPCPR